MLQRVFHNILCKEDLTLTPGSLLYSLYYVIDSHTSHKFEALEIHHSDKSRLLDFLIGYNRSHSGGATDLTDKLKRLYPLKKCQ